MSSRKHEINMIISQLQNTDGIYRFIEGMDIPKTTNSNGIFVNLSVLGDTEIDIIYEFIQNIKVEDISHLKAYEDTGNGNETQKLIQGHPIMAKSPEGPTYPKVKLTALQKTILAS